MFKLFNELTLINIFFLNINKKLKNFTFSHRKNCNQHKNQIGLTNNLLKVDNGYKNNYYVQIFSCRFQKFVSGHKSCNVINYTII